MGASLVMAIGLTTSCGGNQAAAVASYAGPLRSRDIERGGQVFRTFCVPCHAGRVSPEGYRWSPAQMRRQIREGNRAMPAIRDEYLSDEDMESVLAFLTVIGAVDAPLPPVRPADEPIDDETADHERASQAPPAPVEPMVVDGEQEAPPDPVEPVVVDGEQEAASPVTPEAAPAAAEDLGDPQGPAGAEP